MACAPRRRPTRLVSLLTLLIENGCKSSDLTSLHAAIAGEASVSCDQGKSDQTTASRFSADSHAPDRSIPYPQFFQEKKGEKERTKSFVDAHMRVCSHIDEFRNRVPRQSPQTTASHFSAYSRPPDRSIPPRLGGSRNKKEPEYLTWKKNTQVLFRSAPFGMFFVSPRPSQGWVVRETGKKNLMSRPGIEPGTQFWQG